MPIEDPKCRVTLPRSLVPPDAGIAISYARHNTIHSLKAPLLCECDITAPKGLGGSTSQAKTARPGAKSQYTATHLFIAKKCMSQNR